MSELEQLRKYLDAQGIEYDWFDVDELYEKDGTMHRADRHQIIVYATTGERLWDAICELCSWGYEDGLLEYMDENSITGWLTAKEVISRIERSNVWERMARRCEKQS